MPLVAGVFLATLLVWNPTSSVLETSSVPETSSVLEASGVDNCVVDQVEMSWGFKESFRSYLSGAIALGKWEVSGNVTYDTPLFGFSGGTGSIAPDRHSGDIDFVGHMRFAGHGGILNTTLSDPTLRFLGPREAALLFDVTGDTMDFVFIETPDVDFVRLSWSRFSERVNSRTGVFEVTNARVTLTPAGSGAFGTYLAGEVFDPLSFSVNTTPGCLQGGVSWWWLPGGAVALAVLGSGLWFLTRRGRKSPEPEHQ